MSSSECDIPGCKNKFWSTVQQIYVKFVIFFIYITSKIEGYPSLGTSSDASQLSNPCNETSCVIMDTEKNIV